MRDFYTENGRHKKMKLKYYGWVGSVYGRIDCLWDIFFLSLGCVHTTKQRQGIFFKTLYQLVVMLLKFSKASLSKKSEK
jgi:hypothetical protein